MVPSLGGVAHLEDHVTFEIRGSRLEENFADQGGALSSYRGRFEIHDSTLRGNAADLTERTGQTAAGGAIFLTSADFADASTEFGAINRRNAELSMAHSLIQGRFGATTVAARQGGCLFANGDVNRMDGINGVAQDGTEADNRSPVELRDVIFADCDVERTTGPGRGGAIMAILADLALEDSLISFDLLPLILDRRYSKGYPLSSRLSRSSTVW